MSRRPTLPSVSWSTGAAEQEEKTAEVKVEKKEAVEKRPESTQSAESFHAFQLDLEKPEASNEAKTTTTKPRKRTGMSLSDYLAMMKEWTVCEQTNHLRWGFVTRCLIVVKLRRGNFDVAPPTRTFAISPRFFGICGAFRWKRVLVVRIGAIFTSCTVFSFFSFRAVSTCNRIGHSISSSLYSFTNVRGSDDWKSGMNTFYTPSLCHSIHRDNDESRLLPSSKTRFASKSGRLWRDTIEEWGPFHLHWKKRLRGGRFSIRIGREFADICRIKKPTNKKQRRINACRTTSRNRIWTTSRLILPFTSTPIHTAIRISVSHPLPRSASLSKTRSFSHWTLPPLSIIQNPNSSY